MNKETTIPKRVLIEHTGQRLYKLEEKLSATLTAYAKECGRLQGIADTELYTYLIPQALFSLMKSHSDEVGNAVVRAWQTRQP